MYAVYNYKAGSTQAQVLNDLILILTGTTSVAALSASCVAANTSILATVAAGWTLHDASAGTNAQVIKALNQDGTTTKYCSLTASTSILFLLNGFESWNASTHVGTNGVPANTVTSGAQLVWDASGGGFFYIYASGKNIIIMSWTTGGYQLIAGSLLELTRETIPAGYPCHAVLWGVGSALSGVMAESTASFNLSRVKTANATGDITATASLNVFFSAAVGLTAAVQLSQPQTYRDASEAVQIAIYKWGISGPNSTVGSQLLGLAYDVYLTGASGTSNLDEITISGTTYVIFKGSSVNVAVLVPKA